MKSYFSIKNLLSEKAIAELLIVLGIMLLISLTILLTDLDTLLQNNFYDQDHGWIYRKFPLCTFLHAYGPIPGIIIGCSGFIVFLASLYFTRLKVFRKRALFVTLVLFFGAWFIVALFKDAVMLRPRPRHVEMYDGDRTFAPLFTRTSPAFGGDSFPSGHAAIAFYVMTPFFIFRDRQKRLANFFLTAGICYGLIMGISRMAQGGHFFSDIIWSGGFIYLTGWFFYHALDIYNESMGHLKNSKENPPGVIAN